MSNTSAREFWPDFNSGDTKVNDAVVTGVKINRNDKTAVISILCDEFSEGFVKDLRKYLSCKFGDYSVSVDVSSKTELFDETFIFHMVDKLKQNGYPINGIFDGCEIDIDGERVSITLMHGGKTVLDGIDFISILKREVTRVFDKVCEVDIFVTEKKIDNNANNDNIEPILLPSQMKPERKAAKKTVRKKSKYLDIVDNKYEMLLGKSINFERIEPIIDISDKTGRFTIWGDLFFKDEYDEFDIQKSGRPKVFSISDFTDSMDIKLFGDDILKVFGRLKEEDTLVVNGVVKFDRYVQDYVMQARNIARVEREKRSDNAPKKRVELHLHTNMSALDAIPSADKAIRFAHRLGHRAVAITDHGVLQSYPQAYETLKAIKKEDPASDFKVIYGIEAYFIDDSSLAVVGETDSDIGDVVVFDIETTGLHPNTDKMTEIAAIEIIGGVLGRKYSTFVNPERQLSREIIKMTGITNEMVADAPSESAALNDFLDFVNGRPLVAHNASFDASFLRAAARRAGRKLDNTFVDTLEISQGLFPELKRFSLDSVNSHLGLPKYTSHRAEFDSEALALVYLNIADLLRAKGARRLSQIDTALGSRNIKARRPNHMILLAKNTVGLKNLYYLVSKSHMDYFFKKPLIPKSELLSHREGLIIGSACELGEIFSAFLEGLEMEKIEKLAKNYDYLEIQPVENNRFLVDTGSVRDEDEIRNINLEIVRMSKRLGIPAVAAGDVHFIEKNEEVFRRILMHNRGYEEHSRSAAMYFMTTEEMLEEFSYLGELAEEVVVENPNKIADMIDPDMRPIPEGTYTPKLEDAHELVTGSVEAEIKRRYGGNAPELILKRAEKEMDSIIKHGFSSLYAISKKLVDKSMQDGYHVGSRGSVGSSFIANLLGISEVNPLPAHYLCECGYIEFTPDVKSGFDLEDKKCPVCNKNMKGDGHDIPFETFLGFDGDKAPDIDLNFSGEYQQKAHRYTEKLLGADHVFRAGTISVLKEKTAIGLVKKYLEDNDIELGSAEEKRLAFGCRGVKRTTGQHPGGMVIVPKGMDIKEFTPIQHPADSKDSGIITTHFAFDSLHDTLLKLDILGHDVPTMYRYLEELSGIKITDVPMNDKAVYELFTSIEPLGIKKGEIGTDVGTLGIPEMGTSFVEQILTDSKPTCFSDLLQVSGLSHGVNVWTNNAKDLINNGTCTINDVIGTRDDIMVYLMKMGLENSLAFDVMEITRKGNAARLFDDNIISKLRKVGVPDWYIESCKRIKYMFPKAHAAAYVLSAIRICWYKLYKPLDYYATYFTVRGKDIEIDAALGGASYAKKQLKHMKKTLNSSSDITDKEEDSYTTLQITCEMLCRGFKFLPVDLYKSHAVKYLKERGALRLPFSSIKGIGDNAALAISRAASKGGYVSADEMLSQPGMTPSIIDALENAGALGSLPRSSQVSLF
ncbi:MAG: PolC-type DNA polymerase III [Ruminococcaceae bacterium]|nr:PolC-type DNA polymerase III [Oscillospiraceae bacterium]